jgi:CIC family chloride channel protein
MMFEITQDYQIMVPLMVANMLSLFISHRYQPVPIYHALLRQDGVHLPAAAPMARSEWRAERIMRPPVPAVSPETTVAEALALAGTHPGVIVGAAHQAIGVVARDRLVRAAEDGGPDRPLSTLIGDDWPHVHPDHPLDVVGDRLATSGGMLPVVSRTDARRVVGVITRDDLLRWLDRGGRSSSS